MTMSFLDSVRETGRYPAKTPVLFPDKGRDVTEDEMIVWNEAYGAARSYATLTVEFTWALKWSKSGNSSMI